MNPSMLTIAAGAALSLSLLLPAAPLAAQAPRLDFDPSRVPMGLVLHYVKANRDGSQPWQVDVRVVSPTRLDVIKFKAGADDFVQVEADLDPWRGGHLAHAFQHNWFAKSRRATMSATLAADAKSMAVELGNGNSFELPVAQGPIHFYGFDFLGIAALLPHLADPAQAFEVEFVDPNRPAAEGSKAPFFAALARFEPAGFEEIHGRNCRKYLLKGPFFAGFEGALWADAATGRLEKVESTLRTSTDWDKDFKLELQNTSRMDDFAWEKHLEAIRATLAAEAP